MYNLIEINSNIKNYSVVNSKDPFTYINGNISKNGNKVFIVTDNNVYKYYNLFLDKIAKEYTSYIFTINPGGDSKNIDNVILAYEKLIQLNYNKNDYVISFGGGVVGDLAGFIAATFNRGMNFIQIPTTLLSQVDSSIGGKVGIHFSGITNMIGSVYPPQETIINSEYLLTLPTKEISCGISEIIKVAFIHDEKFLHDIENKYSDLRDTDILEELVNRAIKIKKSIVEKDELETDIRLSLNFGHTFGHCLETIYGHNILLHGEAVAIGMVFETYLGQILGYVSKGKVNKLINILKKYKLPVTINDLSIGKEELTEKIVNLMKSDKKNTSQGITFIVPTEEKYILKKYDFSSEELKNFIISFLAKDV